MPKNIDKRTLTPQQILLQEYDVKAARAEIDREIFNEDKDEAITLATNPSATHTANGHTIRRHGSARLQSPKKSVFSTLFGDAGEDAILFGGIKSAFDVFMQAVLTPIEPIFIGSSSDPHKKKQDDLSSLTQFEDDNCVIEMEQVSAAIARKLEEESDELEAKVRELAGITDPIARQEFAKGIIELADEYQMKEHPQHPGHYIHTYARVVAEENLMKARGDHEVTEMICVYRVKLEIGGGTVKDVSRKIGDVLNNNPEEVQLNADEVVAREAAAPAPSLIPT